jgi:hypothetical protein
MRGKNTMNASLKPIKEHSYSYRDGFRFARRMPAHVDGCRQIDWETVKALMESGKYEHIEVGLAEDYDCTKAVIVKDGKANIIENDNCGFFGMSAWATPAVKLFEPNGKVGLYECWILGDKSGFPLWLRNMARE